jgi:hypothetical protein
MARPLRLEFEGALYHLTGRGNSLREIGAMFGGRDYAAVAQRVRRTRLRDQKKRLKSSVAKLKQMCQGI